MTRSMNERWIWSRCMLHKKEESQLDIGGISLKRSQTSDDCSHYRSRGDWIKVYWISGYHLHNDDRIRKNQTQGD